MVTSTLAVGNKSSINYLYRNDGGGVFVQLNGALGFLEDDTYSVAWGRYG